MWAADLNDLAIFAKTVKSFSIFEDCELHVRVYVHDFLRPSFLPLGLGVPDHLNRVRSRPTFRWCSCRCCRCLLLDRCRVATLPYLSKPLYKFQIQYTICVLTRNYLRLGGRLLLHDGRGPGPWLGRIYRITKSHYLLRWAIPSLVLYATMRLEFSAPLSRKRLAFSIQAL